VANSLETYFSSTCANLAKFGRLNWSEIRQTNFTPRVLPFKVIQGHWNRHGSIGYQWFPISDLWAYLVPFPR